MSFYTETRTLPITDCAHGVLRCEVVILTAPVMKRVQREPEVTLRSIEFEDTCTAYRPSDYARLVASRYNDPSGEYHLDWLDVQQKCREAVARGEHLLTSPVAEFMDAQRRAAA